MDNGVRGLWKSEAGTEERSPGGREKGGAQE